MRHSLRLRWRNNRQRTEALEQEATKGVIGDIRRTQDDHRTGPAGGDGGSAGQQAIDVSRCARGNGYGGGGDCSRCAQRECSTADREITIARHGTRVVAVGIDHAGSTDSQRIAADVHRTCTIERTEGFVGPEIHRAAAGDGDGALISIGEGYGVAGRKSYGIARPIC